MSVQMIENRLFGSQYPSAFLLRFHSRPEFIGTLCEGIAAFSEDGAFVSANRSGVFQLGMDISMLRGLSFQQLFNLPFAALLGRVRSRNPIALHLHSGLRVFGVVDAGAATKVSNAAPARRTLRQTPQTKYRALESLDFGDEQVSAMSRNSNAWSIAISLCSSSARRAPEKNSLRALFMIRVRALKGRSSPLIAP
jgi:hypothetical protein